MFGGRGFEKGLFDGRFIKSQIFKINLGHIRVVVMNINITRLNPLYISINICAYLSLIKHKSVFKRIAKKHKRFFYILYIGIPIWVLISTDNRYKIFHLQIIFFFFILFILFVVILKVSLSTVVCHIKLKK